MEQRYLENPYHNSIHAVDVVQSSYVIYKNLQTHVQLLPLELFCLLIAAAVHDVEHPGVNNDFMVNTNTPEAIKFNYRSVNENSHASSAFQLLLHENFNALEGLSPADAKKVMQAVADLYLTTDSRNMNVRGAGSKAV